MPGAVGWGVATLGATTKEIKDYDWHSGKSAQHQNLIQLQAHLLTQSRQQFQEGFVCFWDRVLTLYVDWVQAAPGDQMPQPPSCWDYSHFASANNLMALNTLFYESVGLGGK